ncbi:MAG: zf-HC2 domain-containing protein, partial [Planctomycetes bacterium]|nr:zf-HC2 domain-containing protein [Planctomycetota bacterium]
MMTMNCEKLEKLIELFILDEIDTGERVAIEAHLSVCPACREKEEDYRCAISLIREHRGDGVQSFDFNRNMQMAIDTEIDKVSRRLRFKQTFAAISSVAACLIVGLVLWNNFFSPSAKKAVLVSSADVEVWQYSNVQSISDEFVIRDGSMYVLDSGRISAVNVESGKTKWYADIEDCSQI